MKKNRFGILVLALSLFINSSCKKDKPLIPVLTTSPATEISSSSAFTGGELINNGNAPILSIGVCWNTSPAPTTENYTVLDSAKSGVFTSTLSQLSPNTLYYVRAFASNRAGIGYGNEINFSTNANVPQLTTTQVSNITSSSILTGGNIVSDGGAIITSRGVCLSYTSNPTLDDIVTFDGDGTGSFSSSITGLNENTTFYVRAYATNSAGTGYGNELIFTTYPTGNFMKATVNGIPFLAYTFICSSWLYSTDITGLEGPMMRIGLDFYLRDFKTGLYPLVWLSNSEDRGIMASVLDGNDMIDAENWPAFYAKSGTINITQIDTGTYLGQHAVFINLEATFNFITQTINGKLKIVENGIISYHIK